MKNDYETGTALQELTSLLENDDAASSVAAEKGSSKAGSEASSVEPEAEPQNQGNFESEAIASLPFAKAKGAFQKPAKFSKKDAKKVPKSSMEALIEADISDEAKHQILLKVVQKKPVQKKPAAKALKKSMAKK